MSQTINQEIQLRVGAEDIATLGYQPNPQLVLGELGGFALMNKEGKNKTTVHFSDTIRTAWQQLLQTLQERNIPIPDILRSPRFTPVSQDLSAGIFLLPDRLEVSGWAKGFSWLTDTDDEGNYNGTDLCIFGTGSGYIKKTDIDWDGSGKVATIKNNGATTSDGAKTFNLGDTIKNVVSYDVTWVTCTYLTTPESKTAQLYPLEEPITIPLDTPLDSHLTLHNASDYDVWIPLSEDGQEMYEYIPDFEGTGTHVYHWNRDWVRAVGHQPVALEILDHGWTDRLNAAFLRNLRADYTQLRRDFDEYRQSHP